MKILLIGEYSGLHWNLRDGLRSVGVQCDLISDGDSWKAFNADSYFHTPFSSTSLMGKVWKNIKPFFQMTEKYLNQYDIVQLIAPQILTPRYGINKFFLQNNILNIKPKISLVIAGDDHNVIKHARADLSYNWVDDHIKYDTYDNESPWIVDSNRVEATNLIVKRADYIIPVAYEYWIPYSHLSKTSAVLPMPLNTGNYPRLANSVEGKIRFMHGLNRPGMKGSRFIQEAFSIADKKYSEVATFDILKSKPSDSYVETMKRYNVVVDQALSHSYAMNALIAMALNKVVFSGCEDVILPHYRLSPPVINIKPDPDHIIQVIDNLLADTYQIKNLGEAGRFYVESIHESRIVAKQLIDIWSSH